MAANPSFAPWQLDGELAPELVRLSSNEVWRAARGGQTVYVRITPAAHRAQPEVEAELTWMNALRARGVRVVRPLPSTNGRFVEPTLWQGGPACVACFEAAPGRGARKPADFVPGVIESWASLLADLHLHARDHAPAIRRHAWNQDRVFATAREASEARTRPAQEALRALGAWMATLDTDRNGFGLTHADLHLGNLSIDGTVVTAFDFDDSCHHWFAHDVAVAVTSIRKAGWEYPGQLDAEAAETRFLHQYRARGVLAPRWQARLEAFVAYRIALSACWASRSFELGELDGEMRAWYERSLPWWLDELGARRDLVRAAMAA